MVTANKIMSKKKIKNKGIATQANYEKFMQSMAEIKEDNKGVPNITLASKLFCATHGHPYNDNVRRAFSRLIEQNGDTPEGDTEVVVTEENFNPAKVLFFDIETSLMEALVFSPWRNYRIPLNRIIKDWKILCFSAKWMGSTETIQVKMTEQELIDGDDRRVSKELFKLLDASQVTVAHNADRFDIPKTNAKFLEHGFGLPSPYQSIDTFKLAKKNLAPTSLSLDYFAKLTGSEGKDDSYGLWDRIAKGEYQALEEMASYCDKDVEELIHVFFELRPYLKGLPNMGLFAQGTVPVCSACGSPDLMYDKDYEPYRTTVNEYTVMKCACCGSWSKDRIATKIQNKVQTTPLFR